MRSAVARINITPALGLSMAGFMERDHGATSIHDPLYASCTVLEDDHAYRIALVTCDMINVNQQLKDKVCQQLKGLSNLDSNTILMQATHTHSGPSACSLQGRNFINPNPEISPEEEAYYHFLINALTQVIIQTESKLEPSRIGFASGDLTSLGNNRNEPESYMDSSVNLIKLDDLDGNCKGILVNYACHPTVLTYTNYAISADFPGAMRRQLESINPNTIVAFSQGACGNISTRFTRRESTEQELERLAYGLSGEALKLLALIKMQDTLTLKTWNKSVMLPIKEFLSDDLCKKEIEDGKSLLKQLTDENADKALIRKAYVSLQGYERNWMMKNNIGDLKEIETSLQIIDAGLFQLVTLPGEAFSEIAQKIKINSSVVVCGYANDHVGYILSKEGYGTNGYEKGVSYLGFKAQEILISQILSGLQELGKD